MTDHSKFSRPVPIPAGRLNRMTRMGSMAAGVAGNMAFNGLLHMGRGHRPAARDLLLTPGNMRRVADELARMRGAAMKVGQLMSMDTGDMLPPELSQIMARLRADADFMPPRQLKRVLTENLGPGWLKRFAGFDVRPIAAASIGQVHRATLKDGRALAIKVQYPGIARSIDSDIANVGRLIKLSGLMPPGLDLAPYLEEARQQLHDEANYTLEAKHLQTFNALVGDDPDFALPTFVPDLSSPRILSMSYVPGDAIETLAEAPQQVCDRVATKLIRLMLKELFDFKHMQTDPNFANYRYDPVTDRIALLDFGATRALPDPIVADYRALFQAGLAMDGTALVAPSERLGLLSSEMPEPIRAALLEMIKLVFTEVTRAEHFDFAKTDLNQRLQAMGERLAAHNIVPPPPPMDVLYIQRKFAGMFLLANRLKARVPVARLLREAV